MAKTHLTQNRGLWLKTKAELPFAPVSGHERHAMIDPFVEVKTLTSKEFKRACLHGVASKLVSLWV